VRVKSDPIPASPQGEMNERIVSRPKTKHIKIFSPKRTELSPLKIGTKKKRSSKPKVLKILSPR